MKCSGVMKYKTSSYVRSSACGRPACSPGRRRDREQDRRSGSRAAGSGAIVMRSGPAGRRARAAGSGERAAQNMPRAPPERTQQARRAPPEYFRCVEPTERHRFSSFAASPQKNAKHFLRKVSQNAAAVPRRRRRAPRSGIKFVYVRAAWRFFEKAIFLYLCIFAQRLVCLSGGLRKESKTKKTQTDAYAFPVCHSFVRRTQGPTNCRGPTRQKSIFFPRRAGGGAQDESRLLLQRRGFRRYYLHSNKYGPGEELCAWCSWFF